MIRNTILIVALLAVACSSRGVVKPRSDVIKDASARGLPIRSIDEERDHFFSYEKEQDRRLLQLISTRASNEFRDPSYIIGPGDQIEINVFDVPELNLTAPVRQTGQLSLPLIGAVQASGFTEQELVQELSRKLSAYVRSPQVSAVVSNFGSKKVAVVGAVNKPGSYPLKKGANSVLELLAEAGGVSNVAGNIMNFIPGELSGVNTGQDVESRARLALAMSDTAGPAAKPSGIEVYLDKVLGTSGGIPIEIPLRGGDMIVVPEAGKIMVEGEVEKPGQFDLGRNMTLIGSLAAAGGITYSAKIDEIEIVRDVGESEPARLIVDLEKVATGEQRDVRLRGGDVVRVSTHSGRRVGQDTMESIQNILNFGVGGSVNLM